MNVCHTVALGLLTLSVVLCGCGKARQTEDQLAESEPSEVIAHDVPSVPDVQFALRRPPGKDTYAIPRGPFLVSLDNCERDTTSTYEHRETLTLPTILELDLGDRQGELDAYRAAMEALIRREYGMERSTRSVQEAVTLEVTLNAHAQFTLRWDEIWEENHLDILRHEEVVESVPFKVLVSARLVVVTLREQGCGPPIITAQARQGPPGGETPADTRGSAAPKARETPTIGGPSPEANHAQAIGLVREYLEALAAGDTAKAYTFFHQTYRSRLSYEDYVRGYEPVDGIEIQSVQATTLDKYRELVHVGLTIATASQGGTTYSDWQATYEVIITRGKPPYQRSISDSSLHPARQS